MKPIKKSAALTHKHSPDEADLLAVLQQPEYYSTGSLGLDIALRNGGIPAGQICQIHGPEASGKTTLCLHIVQQAQKAGFPCAWIDADHSLDPCYAIRCGVDPRNLFVVNVENAEDALEIGRQLVESGELGVLVIDPVTALVSQAELTSFQFGPESPARTAAQGLRKLAASVKYFPTAVVATSQQEDQPGRIYHPPEAATLITSLKLTAGLRFDLEPLYPVQFMDGISAIHTRIRVVKSKLALPFHTIDLDIMYNQGISWSGEIFKLGIETKVITLQNSVYVYRGLRLGSDQKQVVCFLMQHSGIEQEIEQYIREYYLPPHVLAARD